MADWQVLLITGPAGAGKTATARCFAAMQEQPTIYLSLDDVRGSVLSGLVNPSDGWNQEVAGSTTSLSVRSAARRAST